MGEGREREEMVRERERRKTNGEKREGREGGRER